MTDLAPLLFIAWGIVLVLAVLWLVGASIRAERRVHQHARRAIRHYGLTLVPPYDDELADRRARRNQQGAA